MSTVTVLSSGLLFTKSIVPVRFLNPPSCCPVTFEPVNSTFEFSPLITNASPLAGGADARLDAFPEFDAEFAAEFDVGSDTVALVLFAAGSSHAAAISEKANMPTVKYFISNLLKVFY